MTKEKTALAAFQHAHSFLQCRATDTFQPKGNEQEAVSWKLLV